MEHVPETPGVLPARDRVGAFRYFSAEDRWEWSDSVARMHGYAPGEVQPNSQIVMSHKHPDDAPAVATLIQRMTEHGEPFSSRHRIVDTAGRTHVVLVVGDRMVDSAGSVTGTAGFYVDITDADPEPQLWMEAAVAEFQAHRTIIEQAKGMLMVVYQIPADRAFDILIWRSQQSNVKLRDLATQLVDDLSTGLSIDDQLRETADHVLLTAHHRSLAATSDVIRRTAS